MPIDKLYGTPALRQAIDSGASAESIAQTWPHTHAPFLSARERHLLYR